MKLLLQIFYVLYLKIFSGLEHAHPETFLGIYAYAAGMFVV